MNINTRAIRTLSRVSGRGTGRITTAVLAALLLGAIGLAATPKTASAEVTLNQQFPVSLVIDNPCEPGINPITFDGFVRVVWYTTPEGSTIMRYSAHYSGTDTEGNQYRANNTRVMEHQDWPTYAPFSDDVVIRLVGKGSTANATIVLTIQYSPVFVPYPAGYPVSVECRG